MIAFDLLGAKDNGKKRNILTFIFRLYQDVKQNAMHYCEKFVVFLLAVRPARPGGLHFDFFLYTILLST